MTTMNEQPSIQTTNVEDSFFESLFNELMISNQERKYPQYDNPIKQFFVRVLKFMDSKTWKTIGGIGALVAFPLFIILTLVLDSSVFLSLLIFSQIFAFVALFPRTYYSCLYLYRQIKLYHIIMSIISVVGTSGLAYFLVELPGQEFFGWSFLQYLSTSDRPNDETNLLNFGFTTIWSAALFATLLISVLPIAAFLEETVFRRNTTNWTQAIVRSLLFGAIHMTMGVPLIVSMIPLSLMGIWLEREYFEGIRRFRESEQFLQQSQQSSPQPQQTQTQTTLNSDGQNENERVVNLEDENTLEQIGLTETTIDIDTNNASSSNNNGGIHRDVNLCSWKPLAGVGFKGSIIPDQKDWRMDIDFDSRRNVHLVYRNRPNKSSQKEKPKAIQLIEAGVKASTLMHLTHNLLAICFSILTYIVVFTFNLDVDPSKF